MESGVRAAARTGWSSTTPCWVRASARSAPRRGERLRGPRRHMARRVAVGKGCRLNVAYVACLRLQAYDLRSVRDGVHALSRPKDTVLPAGLPARWHRRTEGRRACRSEARSSRPAHASTCPS